MIPPGTYLGAFQVPKSTFGDFGSVCPSFWLHLGLPRAPFGGDFHRFPLLFWSSLVVLLHLIVFMIFGQFCWCCGLLCAWLVCFLVGLFGKLLFLLFLLLLLFVLLVLLVLHVFLVLLLLLVVLMMVLLLFFVFLCFPIPLPPKTSKPPVLGTVECAERLN